MVLGDRLGIKNEYVAEQRRFYMMSGFRNPQDNFFYGKIRWERKVEDEIKFLKRIATKD